MTPCRYQRFRDTFSHGDGDSMILRSIVCTYEFTQLHDPEQQHRRPKTRIQKLTIIEEVIRKDRVDTFGGKRRGIDL